MEATHVGQRAWVENELPRVSEILEKFPPLKQPKHMVSLFVFGVEDTHMHYLVYGQCTNCVLLYTPYHFTELPSFCLCV